MYTTQGKLIKNDKNTIECFNSLPDPTYPVGGDTLLVTNNSCYWWIDRGMDKETIKKNQVDFSKCYMFEKEVNDATSVKISEVVAKNK